MALTRRDFPAVPVGVSRNNAAARGWGSGWPHCQTSKWVKVTKAGVTVYVRREVAEMVATLFAVTELLGYDIKAGQTWGAACREISGTRTASNHSWALAVDLNSLANPMGTTFKTNIPPKVISLWWDCGWFWGGWYQIRPDAMHFEYVGKPSDVADDTKKAKAHLVKLTAPKAPPKVSGTPPIKWQARVDAKPGKRTLTVGMVGDDVAFVQRYLAVKPADGKYGPSTAKAVTAYQKMRTIAADGLVGPNTWHNMLSGLG